MSQSSMPRKLTEKEMALVRDHQDRLDRYIRMALFVQSKWFMVIGTAAIAIFLLMVFLIAG